MGALGWLFQPFVDTLTRVRSPQASLFLVEQTALHIRSLSQGVFRKICTLLVTVGGKSPPSPEDSCS